MFITSVVMVIVMAVALTTSSLAWFSASGSPTVTTTALKVTAKAETSSGIAISKDKVNWEDNIDLNTAGSTNLYPLVPFTKQDAYDGTIVDNDDVLAALLAALVGGREAPYISEEACAADLLIFADEDPETEATLAAVYTRFQADVDAAESSDALYGLELNYANLLAQGYISSDAQSYGTNIATTYGAYMIGNKIDNNGDFTDDVYRTGFYTDTFYLQNVAAGNGAADIKFDTTIKFTFDSWSYNESTEQWTSVNDDYTVGRRGAAKYALDPTLCVAVLAQTNFRLTDENSVLLLGYQDAIKTAKEAKQAALATNPSADVSEYDATIATNEAAIEALYAAPTWEIVAYAESKGNATQNYSVGTINLGKTAGVFEDGDASASSVFRMKLVEDDETQGADVDRIDLNKTNATALKGAHTYESYNIPADVVPVKVVAWYDATTLNNNNSAAGEHGLVGVGEANLKFSLKFTKVAAE